MPLHIAITRRVLPGREAEFEQALREFFRTSFEHDGVWGASMLTPIPGSRTRDYGILRTFATKAECDAFYKSPAYLAWDERARTLTEGEPTVRPLQGLEAWFRSSGRPPPRWKMAVITCVGVYALTLLVAVSLGPLIARWPLLLRNAATTALVVAGLTWVIMPFLTRIARGWLSPQPPPLKIAS